MRLSPLWLLRGILYFIAIFHIVLGLGMMLSVDFQKLLVLYYTHYEHWDVRDIYYTRILGSFALVLGTFAVGAAKAPLQNKLIIIGFIEFFILRNISRHLFSEELYTAFYVSPLVNLLTTVFFSLLAGGLGLLLWLVGRNKKRTSQE